MDGGSVTQWIDQLRRGGESAAERRLWERYFSRLAALARKKLNDLPPHARDDEDVALSALNSFFLRAGQGDFPQLEDRTDLWRLLAKITVRKSIDRRRHAQARKRGAGKVRGGSWFEGSPMGLAANEPTPDMLAAINEECQRLMDALDDDLRPIARLKLEGYTNAEIAAKLSRVERTVTRRLELIRRTWLNSVDLS